MVHPSLWLVALIISSVAPTAAVSTSSSTVNAAAMTSAAAPPRIKITYFDIAGRAEPVRLALALSGVPFEDARVSFPEWAALKPKTPYGQLPLMTVGEDDSTPRTQSMAMLRYVGATFSETLYPREQLFDIEEAIGLVEDLRNSWAPSLYMGMRPENLGRPAGFQTTEEGKECIKQMRTAWVEKNLPHFAKYISDMIEKHGGTWIASKDKPTIADCVAYCQLDSFTRGYMDHVPTDCLDGYPTLKAYLQRFRELPEVEAWYAKAKK